MTNDKPEALMQISHEHALRLYRVAKAAKEYAYTNIPVNHEISVAIKLIDDAQIPDAFVAWWSTGVERGPIEDGWALGWGDCWRAATESTKESKP